MKLQEKEDAISKVSKKMRFNSIIVGVCIVIAAFITLFIGEKLIEAFNTPGYEKPIKIYCKAIDKGDYNELMKAFPNYLVEYINLTAKEDYEGNYKEEFMKEIGIEASKITYQITNVTKANEVDLKDAEDVISTKYGTTVDLKDGYQLKVKLLIKDKIVDREEDVVIYVVKIGSKWYVPDLECLPKL